MESDGGKEGEGAGTGMTCINSKASRGKGGFAIHFEACSTSVCVTQPKNEEKQVPKKKKSRQSGGERKKRRGKTELPNFSSLMFPASEYPYLDD